MIARPGQLLRKHLLNVAELAASFGGKANVSKLARSAGASHDWGKKTTEFQDYVRSQKNREDAQRVRRSEAPHAPLSAKCAYDALAGVLPIAEIIANVVYAHHGALHDFISPGGDAVLADKLNAISGRADFSAGTDLGAKALLPEFQLALSGLHKEDLAFGASMLIKYAYSCLVDADRLDAYLFEAGKDYVPQQIDWSPLCERLERHLGEIKDDSEIAGIRRLVSEQCAGAAKRERGIYRLAVPTGGGKTLSGLRFALNHARLRRMDRIIYVIPYLSVTDQTAADIRKALGEYGDCVLEHHSNFLPDEPAFYKLHTGRWDAPIIITTQVQFLESIFSAKAGKLRKLHNMANAVIVFDEVQSLPIKCAHLFNGALNFLSGACGSTILLCTATQPALDKTERPVRLANKDERSIADCGDLFEKLRRVNIVNALKPDGYTPEELASFVVDKFGVSTLAIMNTKGSALALYKALNSRSAAPLVYLSTNMCGAHRSDVIADLRRKLECKEPIICISTQLIEAGVNISFECAVRGIAGLDSIYQAAGRCNRHGEYGMPKPVYVVNVAGENLRRLPDIKAGAETTRRLFDENSATMEEFYRHHFYERRGEMDYNRPASAGGTLYDLLSDNRQGCAAYKNRGKTQTVALRQALRTAGDEFCVIERGRAEVIVPYGDASQLVDKYRAEQKLDAKRRILRELGKYSVSLFEFQLKELEKHRALDYNANDGLVMLNEYFYDEHFGVNLDGNSVFLEA